MNPSDPASLAHVRPREDQCFTDDDLHFLEDHLQNTAQLAQVQANKFGSLVIRVVATQLIY